MQYIHSNTYIHQAKAKHTFTHLSYEKDYIFILLPLIEKSSTMLAEKLAIFPPQHRSVIENREISTYASRNSSVVLM